MTCNFTLERDTFGRLNLTDAAGHVHANIVAVRAFPIHAPEEGISLLDADGHECGWIDHLQNAPEPVRALVTRALEQREFMPAIERVLAVTGFAFPCAWHVQTDRGQTWLTLKGDEDIRRLGADLLIISDTHGVQYLIRNLQTLDKHSRKLLDRFL